MSKAGKPYLKAPRRAGGGGFGGGAAAFCNTAEGQAIEQASIHRSVALQYAVELAKMKVEPPKPEDVTKIADVFYTWLRETSGQPSRPGPQGSGPPSEGTPAIADARVEGGPGSCNHVYVRGVCKTCGAER